MKRTVLVLPAIGVLLLSGRPAEAGFGICRHFIRGDSNLDGKVDLSDGIRTLNHLFSGTETLDCRDAADADDSGVIEITDAVYTFLFLFSGGRPPPAPGPFACGPDSDRFAPPDDLDCANDGACAPAPTVTDFSGFERFEYSQRSGLGFCPELDRVFRVVIVRQAEGYRLELYVLVPDEPGDPRCIPVFETPCAIEELLSARVLTAEEAAAVKEAFAAVPVFPDPSPDCSCIAVDPCVVRFFTWDERSATDFICGSNRITREDAAPLLALFESLRPRA